MKFYLQSRREKVASAPVSATVEVAVATPKERKTMAKVRVRNGAFTVVDGDLPDGDYIVDGSHYAPEETAVEEAPVETVVTDPPAPTS